MRLIMFFMCCVILTASAEGYSQGGNFSVKFESKNLKSILRDLKETTDYSFVYSEKQVSKVNVKSKEFVNSSISDVMDYCVENTNLDYYIKDNVVVIKKASKQKIQLKEVNSKLDTLTIKGVITDETGNTLPGVSIYFQETPEVGISSDVNGNYKITKLLSKQKNLVFSFIGFESKIVEIGDKNTLDIILTEVALGMDEVVVTGYSSISKERATGSFVKIDSKDIELVYHTNAEEKLKAAAPGILLTRRAGDGGDELIIEMRGKATLKGGTSPLIVIDGFPVNTSLSSINPNDIASINILQDAAAASIWGARAANGVIVITTKRGNGSKRAQIEASYNTRIAQSPNLKELQLASSSELIDAHLELMDRGIDYRVVQASSIPVYLDPVQSIWFKHNDDPENYTLEMRDADLDVLRNSSILDQYKDLMLQTGISHDANLSLRGGNDLLNYYFSYNYQNSESMYVGDDKDRHNLTLNNRFKLHEKLTMNSGINFIFDERNYNGLGLDPLIGKHNKMPIYNNILDENGDYVKFYSEYGGSVENMAELEARGFLPFYYNPYQIIQQNDNNRKYKNTRLNFDLTYTILDGLNLKVLGMFEKQTRENRNYSPEGSYNVNSLYNRFAYFETNELGEEVLKSYIPNGGILDLYQYNSQSYTLRSQLDYNKKINKHQINALIGAEFREVQSDSRQREEVGFDDYLGTWQLMDYNVLAQGVQTELSGSNTRTWTPKNYTSQWLSRFASYYLNAAYTYNDKYTLTLSGRIDDGSMFGVDANKRRTPLWSVGGSWNLNEEEFMTLAFLNRLKLRLTYGKNGNVNNAYSAYTTLVFSRNLNWNTGEPMAGIYNYSNPDLKWETTATLNGAIDYAMFGNRIYGTVEVYNRKSTDVLATFNINPMQGVSSRTFNNGEIVNNGFTFQLTGRIGKKFEWLPGVNISYNKNEIVKAEEVSNNPITFLSEYYSYRKVKQGYSVYEIFGFKSAGLDENGDPQIYDADGSIIGINDPDVNDINAVHSIGQSSPKYWGAFTNSFKYKNVALHAVITYKFGHMFRKPSIDWFDVLRGSVHESVADRWQEPGDEEITDIPAFYNGYHKLRRYYYSYSDAMYLDASHIRLQDISLTYDVPKAVLKDKFKIQMRFQVSNLGIIWAANDEGYDPEYVPFGSGNYLTQSSSSATVASRPGGKPQPVYSLGLKINF